MASDAHRSGPRWVETDLATGAVVSVRPMAEAPAVAAPARRDVAGRPLTFERIISSLRPAVPFSRETHRTDREWRELGQSLGLVPAYRPTSPPAAPSRFAV